MTAPDEVPPHDDGFAERFAAQKQEPGIRRGRDGEFAEAGGEVGEMIGGGLHGGDSHVSSIHEYTVLESGVDRKRDGRAGRDVELCAQQGREDVCR